MKNLIKPLAGAAIGILFACITVPFVARGLGLDSESSFMLGLVEGVMFACAGMIIGAEQ